MVDRSNFKEIAHAEVFLFEGEPISLRGMVCQVNCSGRACGDCYFHNNAKEDMMHESYGHPEAWCSGLEWALRHTGEALEFLMHEYPDLKYASGKSLLGDPVPNTPKEEPPELDEIILVHADSTRNTLKEHIDDYCFGRSCDDCFFFRDDTHCMQWARENLIETLCFVKKIRPDIVDVILPNGKSEPVEPSKSVKKYTKEIIVESSKPPCWYCRKGGLVDLYLGGAQGTCPKCGRQVNFKLTIPVEFVEKP